MRSKILKPLTPALIGAIGLFVGWLVSGTLASGQHREADKEVEKRVEMRLQACEEDIRQGERAELANLEAHGTILANQAGLLAGQEAIKESIQQLR